MDLTSIRHARNARSIDFSIGTSGSGRARGIPLLGFRPHFSARQPFPETARAHRQRLERLQPYGLPCVAALLLSLQPRHVAQRANSNEWKNGCCGWSEATAWSRRKDRGRPRIARVRAAMCAAVDGERSNRDTSTRMQQRGPARRAPHLHAVRLGSREGRTSRWSGAETGAVFYNTCLRVGIFTLSSRGRADPPPFDQATLNFFWLAVAFSARHLLVY